MSHASASDAARRVDAAVITEAAKLGQAFAAKRDALQAMVQTQTDSITAAAVTEYGSTVAALAQREQTVRNAFAIGRVNVNLTRTTQAALARGEMSAAIERLRTGNGSIAAQIQNAAHAEAVRMQTAAGDAANSIAASGGTLRSEIAARTLGDLHVLVPDIEPDEVREVNAAVGESKRSAASALLASGSSAGDKLNAAATENGHAFTSSAASIVDEVSAKLPEAEQSIRAGGDAVATLIDTMASSQLAAIDAAERDVLAKIADARTQATNILHAANIAVGELRSKIGVQVSNLSSQETTARRQLQTAGAEAGAQLARHRQLSQGQSAAFAVRTADALRDGVQHQLSELDQVTAPLFDQIDGASTSFAAVVRARRDQALAGIDAGVDSAVGILAQTHGDFSAQCESVRAEALGTYDAAAAQLADSAQPGIQNAQDAWRTKADEFVASCKAYEVEALAGHAQLRSELPSKLTEVVHATVAHLRRSTARKIWDGVKSGLGAQHRPTNQRRPIRHLRSLKARSAAQRRRATIRCLPRNHHRWLPRRQRVRNLQPSSQRQPSWVSFTDGDTVTPWTTIYRSG